MQGAAAFLVLLAGCATAAPWEVPSIPAQRRAEYLLLHPDGGYQFGYDTGEGSSHSASADGRNEVRGSYRYSGPAGPVTLTYTAGRDGFVPDAGHLQNIAVGTASKSASGHTASGYTASKSTSGYTASKSTSGYAASGHAASSNSVSQGHRAVTNAAAPQPDPYHNENADASYNFDFNTAEYQRKEASDPKGNVQGSYSYNTADGNHVAVTYSAGANKGFVIESQQGLDSSSSAASSGAQQTPASTWTLPAPVMAYNNPVTPPKPYSGPLANIFSTGPTLEGAYSFSYQSPESDRQESTDGNGIVKGRYSFVDTEGMRRTVDYQAGAFLGFVPQGDGIGAQVAPVAPQQAVSTYSSSGTSSGTSSGSSGYQYAQPAAPAPIPVAPQQAFSTSSHHAQGEEHGWDENADASYAFAYNTEDHARKETSDALGNVEGEYSYTDPEGLSRTVLYEAGANKGFVVKDEKISQGAVRATKPAVQKTSVHQSSSTSSLQKTSSVHQQAEHQGNADASYSFAYDAEGHSRQESSDAAGNVRGSYSFKADDGVAREVKYEAGANKGFLAKGAHLPQPVPALPVQSAYLPPIVPAVRAPDFRIHVPDTPTLNAAPADASYSFSYTAGESARQEKADSAGNVHGQYSFTADDGVSRTVQYEAGAGKGFVAQGSHLPTNPELAVHSKVSGTTGASASWSRTSSSAPAAPVIHQQQLSAEVEERKPYSYSYQTDSSSKQESADAKGNVVGSYTFVAGDGQTRTINYVAGPESGFTVQQDAQGAQGAQGGAHQQRSSRQYLSGEEGSKSGSGGSYWSSLSSGSNFVLHKFLPPDVTHNQFGYIFDTRA